MASAYNMSFLGKKYKETASLFVSTVHITHSRNSHARKGITREEWWKEKSSLIAKP